MFYRNRKIIAINTLRIELRLVRAHRRATVTCWRFITAACVPLEIDPPQVLHRSLQLDQEVLRRSKFGVHKMRHKPQLNVSTCVTCGQLQFCTVKCCPRNWVMFMMGFVRASGTPDGSRRQRETAHEVFSCIRSCERVARKARKNAKVFYFTQGSIPQWLHHRRRNGLH